MDETQPILPSQSNGYGTHHQADKADIDIDNPQDWEPAYKWGVVSLLAFMAFTVTFTCISLVPVANNIVADLDGYSGHQSTSTASVLLVTIWELGEAAGPLIIAPLSEVYGRYPVYNLANGLFIACTAAGALSQSTTLLIMARFFTGCAVASNVLNPAIIGDIFPNERRGSPMSIVMLTPLIGGAVGPAIAGVVAQTSGWREVMWMSLGLATVAEILFLVLLKETYQPAIVRRRAHELGMAARKAAKGDDAEAAIPEDSGSAKSPVWESIKRPISVIGSSVVLQILSLYGAVGFSFFYVMSTTLPGILQNVYHFPPTLVGSTFLSFSQYSWEVVGSCPQGLMRVAGIGSALGIVVCNTLLDRIYAKLQKPGQPHQPENRLPIVIFGAFTLPLSVVLYGWIAALRLPVPVLILSVALMGFTLILGLIPVTAYVVDAFGLYSASALTAVLIARCMMSTFLPMAAGPLEIRWGYGWGMTVLAGLCMAMAPIPVLVFNYGGKWRQRSNYTKDA